MISIPVGAHLVCVQLNIKRAIFNWTHTRCAPTAALFLVAASAFAAGGPQVAGTDFASIVGPAPQVERMQDGFGATEGPAASRLGFLLFTDAPKNTIWKYIPKGSADVFEGGASASQPGLVSLRNPSNGAVGLTFDRQGRILACEKAARRVTRTEKNGSITVLADQVGGRKLNGPDDIIHAIDGSTYFTDPAGGPTNPGQLPPSVYQILRNGEVRSVASDLGSPNGLAFSPDQLILYVSDAARNEIRAYEVVGDGRLANGKVLAKLPGDAQGGAGGLKTDLKGNIYCAGPGGIAIFAPDGRHLGTIPTPDAPANLAWGDNYSALYITAGGVLYRVKTKAVGTRTY